MTDTKTTTETTTSVVPDFGDDDSDRKICFICSKGNLDMAYPALIMANGALGEGIETHIFFTFWGLDMINKKTMDDLKFTPLGNAAMHMPPGMGKLSEKHMPQGLGGSAGHDRHGDQDAEEADRRPRRARGARVPARCWPTWALSSGPARCRST